MVKTNIEEELKRLARIVDKYIFENVNGSPQLLYKAALHYISSGGKRLRPFLLIKSNLLFNGKMDIALPLAAAIEITHNFTLIHDDIIDKDDIRHNVPTVYKAYNLPFAILAGDLLLIKAFNLINENCKRLGLDDNIIVKINERLSQACIEICEGQALDIIFSTNNEFPSKEEYIDMIRKKTGVLFEVACEIGALAANASKNDVNNLANYGKNIGIAFQLIDDLIGVTGDESLTQKPVGSDIREGKKTIPILLALNSVDEKARSKLLSIFGKREVTNRAIQEAVNIIIEAGIDSIVKEEAKMYVNKALEGIKCYNNKEAEQLREVAEFIVERRF